MRYDWRLYRRLVGAQVRSEMQYRVSFFARLAGNFLVTILDLVALLILMTRFQQMGGWSLAEVTLLYGMSSVSYGLAALLAGSFDDFDDLIIRGEFDRFLLRPLSTGIQLMGGGFRIRRFARLAQGLGALVLALVLLHAAWDPGRWIFLAVAVGSGTLIFLAILIAGAALAFWTPQTGEVVNIFTYGGVVMTTYPMHIYEEWMRVFFSFILPMAFIDYYPALYLLRKPDPFHTPGWLPFLSPVLAVLIMAAALAFWHSGIRRYQSTGS